MSTPRSRFQEVKVTKARFQKEYWKLDRAINACDPRTEEYGLLFAARQALAWVNSPSCAKAPFKTIYDSLLLRAVG